MAYYDETLKQFDAAHLIDKGEAGIEIPDAKATLCTIAQHQFVADEPTNDDVCQCGKYFWEGAKLHAHS